MDGTVFDDTKTSSNEQSTFEELLSYRRLFIREASVLAGSGLASVGFVYVCRVLGSNWDSVNERIAPALPVGPWIVRLSFDSASKIIAVIATLAVAFAVILRQLDKGTPLEVARRRMMSPALSVLAVSSVFLAILSALSSIGEATYSFPANLTLIVVSLVVCVFAGDVSIQVQQSESLEPKFDRWMTKRRRYRLILRCQKRGFLLLRLAQTHSVSAFQSLSLTLGLWASITALYTASFAYAMQATLDSFNSIFLFSAGVAVLVAVIACLLVTVIAFGVFSWLTRDSNYLGIVFIVGFALLLMAGWAIIVVISSSIPVVQKMFNIIWILAPIVFSKYVFTSLTNPSGEVRLIIGLGLAQREIDRALRRRAKIPV